jgi:hypothetical protein
MHSCVEPDTSPEAYVDCECSECREARLRDDERIVYGAREVVEAYRQGYADALKRVLGLIDNVGTPE